MSDKFDEFVSEENGGEVVGEWMSIGSAPKDKMIILYYPVGAFNEPQIVLGMWDNDRYSKKPKPYWVNDRASWWGIHKCRKFSPTMWMQIKAPEHG